MMEREELDTLACVSQTVGRRPVWRACLARMDVGAMSARPCPLAAPAERSGGQVAARLVANRLRAPNPWYTVARWASDAGGDAVCGMPAERRTDARLGRVVELLGPHAVVLKGERARPRAHACRLGVPPIHWALPTIALDGADEAAPDHAATPGEGGQIT
jgi:hypothetical protein